MSKTGPVLIIDDDPDDHEMIGRILSKLKLPNEIKRFYDGEEALKYLMSTRDKPFIIICDINMPMMNGIQLKEAIDRNPELRAKRIPFIILSTAAQQQQVQEAYQQNVQGFFVKGETYDALQRSLQRIVEYWQGSMLPNNS